MREELKYDKLGIKGGKRWEERRHNGKVGEIMELATLSRNENFEEANEILEEIFRIYNKECLGKFINKIENDKFKAMAESEQKKCKKEKFDELRNCRFRMQSRLEKNIKNLNIENDEKQRLLFRLNLFNAMHTLFEKKAEEFKKLTDNLQSAFLNITCAEAQQYIAMEIIKNPDLSLKEFEKYEEVATNSYHSKDLFEGRKCGTYGLVGAFHYYGKRGYKVIFSDPKLDVNQLIDLFVIDENNLDQESKEELKKLNWDDINGVNKISDKLKKSIFKVQIKCHKDSLVPTRERQYNHITDRDAKINFENPTYQFFEAQGRAVDFNCKYLDISLEDAQRLIDESKNRDD